MSSYTSVMNLLINDKTLFVPTEWQDERLLWVLREVFGLVGTRYGCGTGQCGACTVLLDSQPARACITQAAAAVGKKLETIEGLDPTHPIIRAWLEEAVPQCGYCQSGQIMSTVSLLRRDPKPTSEQIERALDDNLCRCGTQHRIRKAVVRASQNLAKEQGTSQK